MIIFIRDEYYLNNFILLLLNALVRRLSFKTQCKIELFFLGGGGGGVLWSEKVPENHLDIRMSGFVILTIEYI